MLHTESFHRRLTGRLNLLFGAKEDQIEVEHLRLIGHDFHEVRSSTSTIVIHAN